MVQVLISHRTDVPDSDTPTELGELGYPESLNVDHLRLEGRGNSC